MSSNGLLSEKLRKLDEEGVKYLIATIESAKFDTPTKFAKIGMMLVVCEDALGSMILEAERLEKKVEEQAAEISKSE